MITVCQRSPHLKRIVTTSVRASTAVRHDERGSEESHGASQELASHRLSAQDGEEVRAVTSLKLDMLYKCI